ncbi:hypothetical protein [Mycobacteroides abscessus]|uniref:hypothetical protein n=1 Tax=Mycobacteroides abscessus TaxID=36809 RepID=UPI000C25CA7E|nr:hypothetical protein [Mycobacteroides abscessus]PVB10684.1 hypothetical protein DDJ71_25735 [Mycobacteroides abscessus]PVB11761.1 hypothetical protein DDJ40_15340 [Mycobacteroides abscessus]
MSLPAAPAREEPNPNTKRGKLVGNVRDALAALPVHFTSQTSIEGLEAGDLFSLNSMLGGSIEIQVVQTLNKLRAVWDPDEEWDEYQFVRSSQTFPDVRLVTENTSLIAQGEEVGLGVELKGWYLLSREGEPSFRYSVNRGACDIHDLLVVVPWHLKNILSGEPVVRAPFVESARYAADMRNYYWSGLRRQKDIDKNDDKGEAHYAVLSPPGGTAPYPAPKSKISDAAAQDKGRNFGRVARVEGLMDSYVHEQLTANVAGIQARYWVMFFGTYSEGAQRGELHDKIVSLITRHRREQGLDSDDLKALLEQWASRLPIREGE